SGEVCSLQYRRPSRNNANTAGFIQWFWRKRIFIEESELALNRPVFRHSDLEGEQYSPLHPNVGLPAARSLFCCAKFAAAKAGAEFPYNRQARRPGLLDRKREHTFDLVFQSHRAYDLPAGCSRPNSSTTFATFSRFADVMRTKDNL